MKPEHSFQTVAMIGLGYIGLPTAAMFAARRLKGAAPFMPRS